jgi:hypothetical protein
MSGCQKVAVWRTYVFVKRQLPPLSWGQILY